MSHELYQRWKGCLPRTFTLLVAALVNLGGLAAAAESLCEPGFVHRPTLSRRFIPVAFSGQDPFTRAVAIQWVGHSSFLITTPGGTTALTDPNAAHPPPVTPDIVTISNEHPTHNQAWTVPGDPRVLRGRMPSGEWVAVNMTVGDLSIRSVPSSGGNAFAVPVQNTIFVFRAEAICIVHLGNLRQPLDEEQRRRIGRPDVLMVPIDGHFTLSYDQIAQTILQLQPTIVLPMHYDFPEHARLFMGFIKNIVPVRTLDESTLKLTRGTLPGATEVVILRYHNQEE